MIKPLAQFGAIIGSIAEQPVNRLGAPDEALRRRTIMALAPVRRKEDGLNNGGGIGLHCPPLRTSSTAC
jgi:hypothetical protein